jgi:CheY-like chemotaxis protein
MSGGEHNTVLVVEDEVLIRIIAADALEDSGFKVLEAANAAEALKMLDEHDEVAVLFRRASRDQGDRHVGKTMARLSQSARSGHVPSQALSRLPTGGDAQQLAGGDLTRVKPCLLIVA